MPKTKISEFSSTPANNTDIDSINISEGCAPSGINDAIRELMSQLKDWQSGTSNDPMVIGSSGSLTLNQGTANGVTYLNGSKVVTSGSALTFDGSNLETTGNITLANNKAFQIKNTGGTAQQVLTLGNDNNVYLGQVTSPTAASLFLYGNQQVFAAGGSEQMRLTSTGLGIGTSSPTAKLSVVKTGDNSRISIGDTASSTYSTLLMYGGSGKYNFQLGVQNNVNNAFEITPSTATGGTTFSTPAFVLDSSGNVGIGTSSPSYKLDVAGAARSDSWIGRTNGSAPTADCAMYRPADNSLGFSTANTERARIDSSGNLLVGKTAIGLTTNGAEIRANGQINSALVTGNDFWNSYNTTAGAYRFYVTSAGTVTATSTTISAISDQRLKENIRDLDAGLDKIMALKPRLYDWKEGKGANIKNARGFIAQEFEEVFPDLIDEWKDPAPEGEAPYKSVRADLIPVLVKAIQELKAEFDAYKASHP